MSNNLDRAIDRLRALPAPRRELLELAEKSGARITGKPDGSEPIEIVFSIAAWRAFDASLANGNCAAPVILSRCSVCKGDYAQCSKNYSGGWVGTPCPE